MQKNGGEFFKGEAHRQILNRTSHDNLCCCESQGNSKKKKKYLWKRPAICPRCNADKVWGHGFVLAYFDGLNDGIWLKRYRCPICGTVLRLRPKGFFSRFQSPIETIRSSIILKQSKDKWLDGVSRSRQLHWLKALRRRMSAVFGDACLYDLKGAFDYFENAGINPVSRSI